MQRTVEDVIKEVSHESGHRLTGSAIRNQIKRKYKNGTDFITMGRDLIILSDIAFKKLVEYYKFKYMKK